MSQVNDNIRAALSTYQTVYPGAKPKITVTYFPDGEVQLFLHEPERPNVQRPHGQGEGKVIEGAAVALRRHLAKMLREVAKKEEDLLKFNVANTEDFIERIHTAVKSVDVPEEK